MVPSHSKRDWPPSLTDLSSLISDVTHAALTVRDHAMLGQWLLEENSWVIRTAVTTGGTVPHKRTTQPNGNLKDVLSGEPFV
jgi:hypothetical protein